MKKIKRWPTSLVILLLPLLLIIAAVGAQAAPLSQPATPEEILQRIEEIKRADPTFGDDFSTWDETWSTTSESSAFMHKGEEEVFSIMAFGGDQLSLSTNTTLDEGELTDYLVEVDTTQMSGFDGENGYGLVFRYVDEGNFYLFGIEGSQFTLVRVVDNELEDLFPLEESTALMMENESGILNQLGVLVEGDQITLLINGEVVKQVEENTYAAGSIGLAVGAFDDNSVEVVFDNVALWELTAAPTPTLTETATPTAMEEPLTFDAEQIATRLDEIHSTEPTYYDEFRREDGSWDVINEENYAFVYQQRALHLQVQSDNLYTYSVNHAVADLDLTNYLVEVDAQVVTMPDDGQYSLIFRYGDDDNFYAFTIRDQEYALLVQQDGLWDAIIDFTETDAIDTAEEAVNHLGVLAEGATITLLVNDTPLAQVEDATFSAGGIGLVAATYTEGGLEVIFDNVEVWQLTSAPAPTPTPTPTTESTLDETAIAAQLAELHAVDPAFYDEFRRADDSWSAPTSDGVTFAVQNRTFQFQIDEANIIDWSSNGAIVDLGLADYLVEVDAALLEGPADGYYGFQFRQVDDANFYRFVISGGAYRLSKVVNNELTTLVDWTDTDALATEEADPAWTRLGVLVQGSTITLLINETAVTQVQDDAFNTGSVALVAGTFDESGLVVAFDNLELWPLASAPVVDETPTPTPTTAPTLDAAAIADQLNEIRADDPTYYDEFRRASDSWAGVSDDDVTYSYQNRTLAMRINTANWISWNVNQEILDLNPADFLVEVDAEYLDGPIDGEYGLVFRYVDNQNFYLYALQAGNYGLWRIQEGEWQTLLSWTESGAIDTSEGAINRLGVLAEGAQMTLLVNDTPIAQVEDSAFSSGGIGLATGALGEGGVEVAFDNVELWIVAAGAAPTPAPTLDVAAVSEQLDTLRAAEPTYADRLDTANEEWYVGESGNGVYSYDRAYLIEVAGPATVWSTNNTLSAMGVNDYVVEVEMETEDDDQTTEHGLIFRYIDNANFYYFYLIGNQYALVKSVDGEFQSILPLAEGAMIESGANLLTVWVQGSQITLAINDEPVAQVNDESFTTGTIALAVGTAESGSATVGFENFAFWALDTGVIPTPDNGQTEELAARLESLRSADPLFSDDFSTWDESWTADADETDFLHDEAAEHYQIGVNTDRQLSFSQNTTVDDLGLTDYLLEVDAVYADGPSSGDYGLLFRVVDNRNFYFFGLSGNAYMVSKLVDNEWTTLIDWTEADAIDGEQGAINHLGVLVEGDGITLLVNDTVLAQIQDDTFTTGGIALAAGTYDESGYVAIFDNVVIWATAEPVVGPEVVEFVSYEDDAFALQHPADWTVEVQEGGLVLVQNSENEEGVGIWPLYSESEITPEVADQILHALADDAAPDDAEWGEIVDAGEGVRRMVGGDDTHTAVAAITWVNSAQGAALQFYFMAASHERYATLEPIFTQILESFAVTGVPTAATNVADLPFVTWEDPDENAFTVDVPEEWTVSGGLERVSSLDARPWLFVTSPDEEIFLMVGADDIPIFIVPSAALEAQGYGEGDSYFVGDTELVLQPYTPGEEFAERYGLEMLGLDVCEIGEAQPLPELKAAISDYIRANDLADDYGTRQDAGAITYTCGEGDNARTGYLFAFTLLAVQQGVELWQAATVLAYEATPARLAEAQTLLAQVIASWQLSADWLAQQPETTAADAERRSEASNHFADLIADALSGSTTGALDTSTLELAITVTDEATSTDYDLLGGGGYGWIDETGNVLGTQTPVLPADLNVAELVQAE